MVPVVVTKLNVGKAKQWAELSEAFIDADMTI